ncbi:MAG: cob(I)yrinic acid a,c-diamide adenosyltransferase [Chitinophagaceae bacterium]|nr:cob(I)yrinic acid a,c-diamide adenosyltransferase [Chitinophagaceae bacterium]
MSFKIYTKTGDTGKTSLIGGTRVSKNHIQLEAYGTVDELNSWIGHLADISINKNNVLLLKEIQNQLFTIGSILACDTEKDIKMNLPVFNIVEIQKLENAIDVMETSLPALKNFVLPGGNAQSSLFHIARCVCRRCERICVALQENITSDYAAIIQYLNRLSDYLFVAARMELQLNNGTETLWESNK